MNISNQHPWDELESAIGRAAEYVEPSDDLRPRLLESARRRWLNERSLGSFLGMALAAMILAAFLAGRANSPVRDGNFPQRLLAGSPISLVELCRLTDMDCLSAWGSPDPRALGGENAWQAVRVMSHLRAERARALRVVVESSRPRSP